MSYPISIKLNKLMRMVLLKLNVLFLFSYSASFFIILLGVCPQFLNTDNSIVSKWYQNLHDKSGVFSALGSGLA